MNGTWNSLPLTGLDLAYNKIHTLKPNAFKLLPNLQELNLEGNDFRVLDIVTQGVLDSLDKLEVKLLSCVVIYFRNIVLF